MIDLRQTGAHLPAVGPRGIHDHQGRVGFDERIGAVSIVADDMRNVAGISGDWSVGVDPNAAPFELVSKDLGRGLILVAGDDDGPHLEPAVPHVVDELEGVGIVGDAEVSSDLSPVDVTSVDAEDDLGLTGKLLQEAHLDVGVKTRQHSRRVIVEHQLAAELEVELAAHLAHSLENGLALLGQVTLVVERDGIHEHTTPPGRRLLCKRGQNSRAGRGSRFQSD